MGIKDLAGLFKHAATGWSQDSASRFSAALSYYAIFSLAPLLVILVAITGLVFGAEAARGQMADQLSGLLGKSASETVQAAVAAVGASKKTGIIASVVGVATLLLGASTVFGELRTSLNLIWGVKVRSGQPISTFLRDRLLSFSLVLSTGFLLLVSLMISTIVAAVSAFLTSRLPLPPEVWKAMDFVLSVIIVGALFGMIFKVLPDVRLRWHEVVPGAFVTALLFTAGKAVLAWYLGTNSAASAFGAAGSVVIVLLWVYYTSCLLFFGAEFTKAWVLRLHGAITPGRHAMLA